jgi:hypothetical protein
VLYDLNAIVVVPSKSISTNGPGGDDSLTIFCDTSRVPAASKDNAKAFWNKLKDCFAGSSIDPKQIGVFPTPVPNGPYADSTLGHADEYSIELRSIPSSQPALLHQSQVIPAFRTRSALGSLMKAISQQWIVDWDATTPLPTTRPWYYLDTTPQQLPPDIFSAALSDAIEAATGQRNTNETLKQSYFFAPNEMLLLSHLKVGEQPALQQRRYIIIRHGNTPKCGSRHYVDCSYRGTRYWIDGNDKVSQQNFELMSLLFTIQSQTAAAPPPYPAITVGSH